MSRIHYYTRRQRNRAIATAILIAMMIILALLLLTGCAETRIYEKGHLIARIQGDSNYVEVNTPYTKFQAWNLNHSIPTKAGGKVAGKVVSAAAGVATTAITGAGVGLIPAAVSSAQDILP